MAERPWRCSNCGTINEPVANSCRTCGKWPSLFDLEDNAVDEADVFEPVAEDEPMQTYEYEVPPEPLTVEVEPIEAETFEEPEPVERKRRFGPPTTQPVLQEGEAEGRGRWVSWLVPLAFVAYLVISYVFSSR
jgi:hypothetical protein